MQSLFSAPDDVSDDIRDSYFDWVDRRVVQDIRANQPEVFTWILDRAREMIQHFANKTVLELGDVNGAE